MTGRALARQVLAQQRRRAGLASVLFVSHQIGEILVPVVAGLAIDRAVVNGDGGALVRWLVLLALVFAVLSTSWRWADRLLTQAVEDAAHRLRLRLAARLLCDGGTARPMTPGEAVSLATDDAAGAARIVTVVAAGIASTAALVVAAAVLLVLSPRVGAVVLVGLPVVVVGLHLVSRPLERRTGVQRAEAARAASMATDLLSGLRAIHGMRASAAAGRRYRGASRRSLDAALRSARLGALHEGGTVLATGAFVALVALVAGRSAADGDLSVGGLVAAVGVAQFLVGPLWRLGFAAGEWARARASSARVAAVLDAPPVVSDVGRATVPNGRGAVALLGVRHGGLDGFDLDLPAGAFVGLACTDPADADALVELLARRRDPQQGRVEVDGVAFDSVPLTELRRLVVVAPHDAVLFGGSVLDNVASCRDRPEAHDEEVGAALAAAGAGDLERGLADGLITPVGGRGLALSGGQRQRVALARALLTRASVLVLHDPTTSVDPVTEQLAADGIRRWRQGRTTVVVTTSPALLAVADEVVVIDRGRVVDRGPHVELVADGSPYAALVLS